jgi:hypothetical protein
MATIIGNNQVKLNSGQTVQAQQGGWYDGQQFWGGTLSQPGQINSLSNQQGAGQAVSQDVIAQTNPANVAYINQQRQKTGLPPSPVQAPVNQPAAVQPTGQTSAGTGAGVGITPPATINLPSLYESLYASSGIRDIEAQLSAKTNAYNEQVAKIKDNPYLSEATMTGRIAKLDQKFAADSAAIKNDIATKKADIETQLNLQTKQFDINSQAAQQAFSQFNSLLSAGALNDASGEDIANITRATGISSDMIYSAINAQKKKNVNTSVIQSTADSGEVTVSVINTDTGEIIKQSSLGKIGNQQKAAEPKEATTATQQSSVGQILSSYFSNEAQQAQISPEDLYRELLLKFPLASSYIQENWTADDIRKATQ